MHLELVTAAVNTNKNQKHFTVKHSNIIVSKSVVTHLNVFSWISVEHPKDSLWGSSPDQSTTNAKQMFLNDLSFIVAFSSWNTLLDKSLDTHLVMVFLYLRYFLH